MRGLTRFCDKDVSIYDQQGNLLVTGRLRWNHPGFIIEGKTSCYLSRRSLCRKKVLGNEEYQFVAKGNYNIFARPSTGGFKYKF